MSLTTHSERLWQNCDVLLYLCRFMDGQKLVLFATSCRLIYRTIVDRPGYWEKRYKQAFSLGDRREQEWLTWYSWYIDTITKLKESTIDANQPKREPLAPSAIPNINDIDNKHPLPASYLQYVPDFNAIQWFYAYQRRRQANHNFMSGRFKTQICQLPVNEHVETRLFDVNPWYTLALDTKEDRLWSIQHDVFSKRNDHNSEELMWRELIIPLSPSLFDCKDAIFYGYGMRRFVVANVAIMAYNDVEILKPGDPIVNLGELKAQYIREAEHKAANTLDEHLNISPNITPSNEQKISQRSAIVVWSNAGNSSPSLIYLAHGYQYGGREESSYFSDIHNEWILLKTIHLQYPYQRFDLFDLDANRWIEGSKVDDYSTSACIQFASRDRCQFLTCTIIDDIGEFNIASTFMAIQDSQTFTSDNHSLHILWELFDAQKGQSKSKNILSDQITIPYWPNASVEVETYTERMCLISIFHPVNNKRKAEDKVLDTLLMFFVFGKISANTSPQSLFDARDYGQLRPIDGSDKGYILWSRSMVDSIITKLYSEKIIVLQTGKTLDVLDARNGNLLRSISLPLYANLIPFLGSLCQAVDRKYKKSWFIDMHTGRIYKPPACLIKKVTQDDNEDESLGLIEVLDLPSARQDKSWISFGYKVSSGVIGLIDGNGRYEAYML